VRGNEEWGIKDSMHGTSRDNIRLPLHNTECGITRQVMYVRIDVTLRRFRAPIVAAVKQSLLHTGYVRQYTYNARATLSSLVCLTLQSLSTLSHKRHDFRKKVVHKKFAFSFSPQLLCETFLVLRGKGWHMIKNVCQSSRKVPEFLTDFNKTWIF